MNELFDMQLGSILASGETMYKSTYRAMGGRYRGKLLEVFLVNLCLLTFQRWEKGADAG